MVPKALGKLYPEHFLCINQQIEVKQRWSFLQFRGKMYRERFYVEETFREMADVKCFVDGGGKAKTAFQGVCDCWPRCFCCFGFPCGVGCWVSATVLGCCCAAVVAAGFLVPFSSRVLGGGKIPKEYGESLFRVNVTSGSRAGAVDFGISSEISCPRRPGLLLGTPGFRCFHLSASRQQSKKIVHRNV